MNAQADEVQEATSAKPKTEVETVKMDDGTEEQFAGKKKLNKYYDLNPDGSLGQIRFNFRNGRQFKTTIPQSLLGQFAGHGAIQKYGDELAGLGKPGEEVDLDDMVLQLEKLDESIQAGKWSTRREGDGLGGTSVLIKALVAYGGKTVEQVKKFLADKDAKFKAALRLDDKRPNKDGKTMAAIVKEIEAEKASKGAKVDTSSALDELDSI